MNSKILQDKIREIQDEEIEMRLLKRSEKNQENGEDKERVIISSSQSTVSMKHYDQLICDLKCPGCVSHLQAPIYLCMNGHSVCRLCRVSVKTCPVCDGELTNIRSFTLERLSGKFQFPCNNLRNGCLVRLPLELMKWHDEKCVYKKTSCFMGKIWHDCAWRGRENEWLQHCKQKHSQKILHKQESFELIWNYETLKDNAGPIIAYYLIQNFGETFNLYQIHEAKHSTLTWTIILANHSMNVVGKKPNLPKFCFEFEFYNKQDPNYLLIQRFPVHYEDSEDVLDDAKCVKVSLNDVQRFLDEEKNLFYRVKIISRKDKKDRWDSLLEKTVQHHNEDEGFSKNDDDFAFFDDVEDKVFMDEEKLVVVREPKSRASSQCDDADMLKQIYEREFNSNTSSQEKVNLIQKPPRKSLEYRKSLERNSYSSHHAMPFDG